MATIYQGVFLFYIAMFMNKTRKEEVNTKKWYLLLIPAVLLVAGVMTNDYHGLVFYFPDGPVNASGHSGTYVNGPILFVIIGWEIVLIIVSLIIILRKRS